jgi:hypothetical protein
MERHDRRLRAAWATADAAISAMAKAGRGATPRCQWRAYAFELDGEVTQRGASGATILTAAP